MELKTKYSRIDKLDMNYSLSGKVIFFFFIKETQILHVYSTTKK